MRMICSQCRNPVVVDEMSEVERIACPTCGTEVRVRVGAVAEPQRIVAPPPLLMPVSPVHIPPPVVPAIRPPVMSPVVHPIAPPVRPPVHPPVVAPIVAIAPVRQPLARSAPPAPASPSRGPIRPPVVSPGAPLSSVGPESTGPQRGCPACGEKMALAATRCGGCGANYQRALRVARGELATDAPAEIDFEFEKSTMNGGVVGGIGVMVLGAVWFLVGYFMLNRIFFYAPILVVIGFVGVVNGLADMSRERAKRRPRGWYK